MDLVLARGLVVESAFEWLVSFMIRGGERDLLDGDIRDSGVKVGLPCGVDED